MPSDYMNYASKQIFEDARLVVAILDYLDSNEGQKTSVKELSEFFEVPPNTIRSCLIPCLKDGMVAIEHNVAEIFYWIKKDGL